MTEAAMTAAREIMEQIEPGNRVTVEGFAAIIAKHFPSPGAAEGDVERLRAALREWAIPEPPNGASWVKCRMCGEMWDGRDEGEKHKPNCLAALSAQPASVGGVGEEITEPILKRIYDWSMQRLENTERIGKTKTGEDRQGWVDDAVNWSLIVGAIKMLQRNFAASPTAIEPQAGWRDGVEAAARYHDKQALEWDHGGYKRYAKESREHATAIRALTPPANRRE